MTPESIPGDWFYLEFVVDAASNGYTQQSGKIYTEQGQLVHLPDNVWCISIPRDLRLPLGSVIFNR